MNSELDTFDGRAPIAAPQERPCPEETASASVADAEACESFGNRLAALPAESPEGFIDVPVQYVPQ